MGRIDPSQAITSLSLADRPDLTVLIVGGTYGVGAAIAERLAQLGCARIIVTGRSADKGEGVAAQLSAVKNKGVKGEFVSCDVSTVKGVRDFTDALSAKYGKGAIHHVIQTQRGHPTGEIKLNADGVDTQLFIQCISRFAIPLLLHESATLDPRATITSICSPGQSLADLDVEDLNLEKRYDGGRRWKLGMFLDQSARESSVLDAAIEEMAIRNPEYRLLHLAPGLVHTPGVGGFAAPFPLNIAISLGLRFMGQTPEAYAAVPIYLAFHPGPQAAHTAGSAERYDHKAEAVPLGSWAADPQNRHKLWEKLVQLLVEEAPAPAH